MKRISVLLLALSMLLGFSLPAQALLIDQGGGLVYDTDYDITWLQDANYAKTSNYDGDGLMTWGQAMTWAANLSYYDTVRDYTYTDWRLPTALNQDGTGPDSGYVTGSEMGHLYYTELGNPVGGLLTNTGPFSNMQSYIYWSDTEYAPDPDGDGAWVFSFNSGYQGTSHNIGYGWAVRPGNVIPEPGTMLLLGTGLLSLVGCVGRKKGRV